ncbi:glyoxalase superfamily protein, partial [Acinetobacter baumannii]
MAQTLRDALKTKSVTLSHSESLELIAKTLGFHDWNVLSATIQASRPSPAAVRRSPVSASEGVTRVPVAPMRDIVFFPQSINAIFV